MDESRPSLSEHHGTQWATDSDAFDDHSPDHEPLTPRMIIRTELEGATGVGKSMHIRRGEQIGGPPVEKKIDHCLSDIEDNGFVEGIEWDTKISRSVTVEELVGALVHSENELPFAAGNIGASDE